MTPISREDYYFECLDLLRRNPPYVWGGRTLTGVDCSGFVALSLKRASLGAFDRSGYNTDAMWTNWPRILSGEVKPGDLVLYFGKSTGPNDVSHVMVCAGAGVCFGMPYGGSSDVDPVASRAAGKVAGIRKLTYRTDIAGFVRPPVI